MKILPKMIRAEERLYVLHSYERNQVLARLEGLKIFIQQVERWKSWLPGIYIKVGDPQGPYDSLNDRGFQKAGRLA